MSEQNPQYWRSLGELADSLQYREAKAHVPGGVAGPADGFSRRNFLSLMGASFGLAGLAACRRPEEKILPYSRAPENVVPGNPTFYATAFPWQGTAIGLLVESHEGRPTKIEGNPKHPESLGGSTAFAQASILDLYDPDRSTGPSEKGQARTWDEAADFLKARGAALKAQGGQGLAVLVEAHRSPTLSAALAALEFELPQAKVYRYAPFDRDRVLAGARLAFGKPLEAVAHLDQADVVVALDCDLLLWEGSPVRQAREFADRRRVERPGDRMARLYAVESAYSVTGASADHRLRVARKDVPGIAFALARELAALGLDLGEVAGAGAAAEPAGRAKAFVKALAKDLLARRKAALLVAGAAQPPAVHALLHALHHALGSAGRTVTYATAFEDAPEGSASLQALAGALRAGEVDTLLVLGGNPALTAGPEVAFAEALAKVKTASVHLATHLDETGALTTWHLNRAHDLETWGDVRAQDGTATILQPLIAPLFGGRSAAEVVALLLGRPRKAHDLVRETWRATLKNVDFELAWRRALHDGFLETFSARTEAPPVDRAAVAAAARALAAAPAGLEVSFHPDWHAFDGRFANNGWLQEMPDTMAKQTWGNAALVSPATAARLGLADGELVELKLAAPVNAVTLPVCIAPGQADDSIAVTVGQGRRRAGRVGNEVGHDTYPLRLFGPFDAVHGVELRKVGGVEALARTQEHALMHGVQETKDRPLVREATLARFNAEPDFAPKLVESPPLKSLFADHDYKGQRWGLVIDLNACVGCNACAVACQAENNVPLVSKTGVMRSREMHWLRIDRYFTGPKEDPRVLFQPVACHHCENAPCEQVCPVGATSHSPEGLNDMAYNRCIGTRYCANNCPYKVRRFNFFNYTKDTHELHKMRNNPEVTVRFRGVMEKCTYCVHRIQNAKIEAHKAGREKVPDGVLQTACQQACPAQALRFGDLNDPKSEVARLAGLPRDYAMLAELNVRPRTSFLARVRNPNPELEGA